MLTKNRYKALFAILFAVLAFLAVAAMRLNPRAILVIEERGGQRSWLFALPDSSFALGFTHCVMKTPVVEEYRMEESGLVLVRTVYQSYGVGLPFLPEEGELTVEDGVFVLELRREIGELHMAVSAIPDHWLQIGEEQTMLSELLGGSGAVTLRAEKRYFWCR